MANDTKLNLNSNKFEQTINDTLTLSGVTIIEGSLIFSSGYTPTGNTSVATKLYVDENTTGSSLTFNNGLTDNGGIVSLGGNILNEVTLNSVKPLNLRGKTNINIEDTVYQEIVPNVSTIPAASYILVDYSNLDVSISGESYVYNFITGYRENDFEHFIIVYEENLTSGDVNELVFSGNTNPLGWTGDTVNLGGGTILVGEIYSNGGYVYVRETDSSDGGTEIYLFNLAAKTLTKVSNVIPQIINYLDPLFTRTIIPFLQIEVNDNNSNFYKLLFNDTTTNTIYIYDSQNDTLKTINGGDVVTGDLSTLPTINRASFDYRSTPNGSNTIIIETTGNTVNDRFLIYNLTGDSVTSISIQEGDDNIISELINLNNEDIIDYNIFTTIGQVFRIFTKTKSISFGSNISGTADIVEYPFTVSTNFGIRNKLRRGNFLSSYIYYFSDDDNIVYELSTGIVPFVSVSLNTNYLYTPLPNNASGIKIVLNNRVAFSISSVRITINSYESTQFYINTTANGFQYPTGYQPSGVTDLTTYGYLTGQTINDYTGYVSGVTKIAGADAFNDLKTRVDTISASTNTFNNGLTETGGTVSLGGSLTGDTVIDSNVHSFIIDGGTISGGLTLLRADIGSSINEPLIRFKNQTGNNVTSGFVDINIGTCNINQSSGAWGNIAIGQGNLTSINATGDFAGGRNIAIGCSVGTSLTTGNNNVLLGRNVFQSSTTGAYNIVGGYGAARDATSAIKSSVIFGLSALNNVFDGTGSYGVVIGAYAGANTTCFGEQNTLIGNNVLVNGDALRFNTVIGAGAARNACLFDNNIAIGVSAGRFMCNTTNVTAIGRQAGWSLGGNDNVVIGSYAAKATNATGSVSGSILSGDSNILIGNNVTFSNSNLGMTDTIVIGNDFAGTGDSKVYLASKGDIELIANHDTDSAKTEMTSSGLYYDNDYSATGGTNPRWIPDVDFITGLTSNNSLTFNNGLTETGGTVSLGGSLTGDTVINTNDNGFAIGTYSYALGNNSVAIGGYAYTTTGGTNSVALASGAAQGRVSFGVSYGIACACGAFSHGRSASGCYSVGLASGIAIGNHSLAVGDRVESSGNYSVAIGGNNQSLRNVRACGTSSKNISSLCSAIDNIGALGNYSSIFGGVNNNISTGNTNATIVGGNTIDLTGTTYIDSTVLGGNVAIFDLPSNGTSGDTVLVRDSSTGIIKEIAQSGLTGGGGGSSLTFNNGLIDNGGIVSLGGILTGNTVVNTNGNIIAFTQGNATGTSASAFGGNSYAYGNQTFAAGGASSCGNYSIGIGYYSCARNGTYNISIGAFSDSNGQYNVAVGAFSNTSTFSGSGNGGSNSILGSFVDIYEEGCNNVAIGRGTDIGNIGISVNNATLVGYYSSTCSNNTVLIGDNSSISTNSPSSVIIGSNINIDGSITGATIIGGYNRTITASTLSNHVVVSKLAIEDSPSAGTSGDTVLVRDSSTGIIKEIQQSGLTGGGSNITSNDTEIIFNNNGSLSGSTAFTFSGSTQSLTHGTRYGGYSEGQNSIVLAGDGTGYATGIRSVSIGRYAYANGQDTIAHGNYSSTSLDSCFSAVIGGGFVNGTSCFSFTSANGDVTNSSDSVAFGRGSIICGSCSLAIGQQSHACNSSSFAIGFASCALVDYSISITNTCQNTSTNGYGANAIFSSIFGGQNTNITSGNTGSTLIGGDNISLTGTSYIDSTVLGGNVAIFDSPSSGTSSDPVLVRDSSTGIIKEIAQSSIGGGSGASVAGNDTEIQFNDGGSSLGAFSGFTFNQTTKTLDVEGEIAISGTSVLRFGYSNASVELGINSSATANNSTAIGSNSIANQITSTAVGALSCATALSSSAFGYRACAFGQNSTSLGLESATSGFGSVAIGYDSKGTGGRATVVGSQSVASGNYSLALGTYASATTNSSISIGRVASSNNIRAVAIGYNSEVTSIDGIALGSNAATCNTSSVSIGTNASSDGSESIAIGRNSTTCGLSSVAIGYKNIASGNYSTVIGGCYNSTNQNDTVILGGIGQNITGSSFANHTIVQNLAIISTPVSGDASTTVMVRDSATGIIQERAQSDVASASDMRLKDLGEPIIDAIEGLSNLNTYEFQFNDKIKPESLKGKTRYGLIAQELEKVFPHVVENDYKIGDEIYKSVRYADLIPVLVKGIQELSERVNLLEKK